MKKSLYYLILFGLIIITQNLLLFSQKQEIYIPLNIRPSYEKGIRSIDGKPGKNYWQNKADYKIKAEIFPKSGVVKGSEVITYYNNSPDELKNLVIRFYQDIFKKGNNRDRALNPDDINDGVKIEKLFVNDEALDFSSTNSGVERRSTNMFIYLKKPLKPEEKIKLEINWNFTIPKITKLRMGTYDSSSYFVAYWYPQVSVYDDIDGWDTWDYTGTVEFYNDFNNFDVEVTAPKNFIVWAGGVLKNPEEVLSPQYLGRYKKALTSENVVNIITAEDCLKGDATLNNEKLVWKFASENVMDFAFATSDHYLWDGNSAIITENGKKVFAAAAYKKESKDFYEVAKIAKSVIEYLSKEMPGVPFPYPQMTAFNGGMGGMEFPMMINDQSVNQPERAVGLTAHEIAHTYFPFYMGINEKKYAWMDEGWAVFLPMEFSMKPDAAQKPGQARARGRTGYSNFAGKEMEMPLIIPSVLLRGDSYRTAAYDRSGVAYRLLRDYLGNDLFKKALKEYLNRWNGKHPIPYDFFYTFNNVTNEDLSWFWKPWFYDFGYPDLGIKIGKNPSEIIIEKKGNFPVPVYLLATYDDGTEEKIYQNAGIWKGDKKEIVIKLKENKKLKKVEIGDDWVPDADLSNNTIDDF